MIPNPPEKTSSSRNLELELTLGLFFLDRETPARSKRCLSAGINLLTPKCKGPFINCVTRYGRRDGKSRLDFERDAGSKTLRRGENERDEGEWVNSG